MEQGYEKSEKNEQSMTNLKEAHTVRFSADISNEEALLLEQLHNKYGIALLCPEAKAYQYFLHAYASASKEHLFKGNLDTVSRSEVVITFGVWFEDDRVESLCMLRDILREKKPKIVYMHPMEDRILQTPVEQFIKYEVGSEEGVAALLVQVLLNEKKLPEAIAESLEALDIGYLSAESNVGEEELDTVCAMVKDECIISLIVGSDLYAHPKAEQIAKLLGLLECYAQLNVVCLPPAQNALGVALLCTLDEASADESVVYESCHEGTFINADKLVCMLPNSQPDRVEGLNALGAQVGYTVQDISEFSTLLPKDKGFHGHNSSVTTKTCLYALTPIEHCGHFTLDEIDELPVYDGAVIYTYETTEKQSEKETLEGVLSGSKQFALAAKLQDGERISFVIEGVKFTRVFKIDTHMKGVIALNPTFDIKLSPSLLSSYRFSRLAFENTNNQKIGNNNE